MCSLCYAENDEREKIFCEGRFIIEETKLHIFREKISYNICPTILYTTEFQIFLLKRSEISIEMYVCLQSLWYRSYYDYSLRSTSF